MQEALWWQDLQVSNKALQWRGVPASDEGNEDTLTKPEKFPCETDPSQCFKLKQSYEAVAIGYRSTIFPSAVIPLFLAPGTELEYPKWHRTLRTPHQNGGESRAVSLAQNKDGKHVTLRNVGQIQVRERERESEQETDGGSG